MASAEVRLQAENGTPIGNMMLPLVAPNDDYPDSFERDGVRYNCTDRGGGYRLALYTRQDAAQTSVARTTTISPYRERTR